MFVLFCFFLIGWLTLNDFQMLNLPCILWINSFGKMYYHFCICCIEFTKTLFSIFCIYIHEGYPCAVPFLISLSGFFIRIKLVSSNFLEEKNWPYFYLKYLVEVGSETTWIWSFLCGRLKDTNIISLIVISYSDYLFPLTRSLAVCFFQGFGPFSLRCPIYRHKVIHSISLIYVESLVVSPLSIFMLVICPFY